MAQVPLAQYLRRSFRDFTGGKNSRADAIDIEANQFVQLDNARTADHDILEKAPGYVVDGSPFPNVSDSFIRMLSTYLVGSSVNSFVVAAQDDGNANATYKVDFKQSFGDGTYNYIGYTTGTATFTHNSTGVTGVGTAWSTNLKAGDKIKPNLYTNWYEIASVNSDTSLTLLSNYTDTTTGSVAYMARIILNLSNIPVSRTINNKLVITNGSETPMEFDNATVTLLQSANAPKANFIELHKSRVFMANTSSNPSRLFWSASNDETTWNAASFADIFPNDNGYIVAIRSFAGSLLVFKSIGTVYRVYGEFDQDTVGQPTRIFRIDTQDNIGTIFGRSVVINDDNKLYFLAQTGFYSIDYNMSIEKVSWDIQPDINNLVSGTGASLNKAFSFNSRAGWNSGTLSGVTIDRLTNKVAPFFDAIQLSGAYLGPSSSSVFIDSNNDVHVAWITSDRQHVKYTKWAALDNSTTTQTAFNVTDTYHYPNNAPTSFTFVDSVAISKASSGNIGIAIFSEGNAGTFDTGPYVGGHVYAVLAPYGLAFAELISGAWHVTPIDGAQYGGNSGKASGQTYVGISGLCCTYNGGTDPYIVCSYEGHIPYVDQGSNPGAQVTIYPAFYYRSSGTFHFTNISLQGRGQLVENVGGATFNYYSSVCNIFISGSSIYVVGDMGENISSTQYTARAIYLALSTDGGATFSYPLLSTTLGTIYLELVNDATQPKTIVRAIGAGADSEGQITAAYQYALTGGGGDSGKIIRYNLSANTPIKTTVDAGPAYLDGYANQGTTGETFLYLNSFGLEELAYDQTYRTGTADFTSGNAAVTGHLTKWTSWVKPGDTIWLASDVPEDAGTVLTVNSDTSITLTAGYNGTTALTSAYVSSRRNFVTATGSQNLDSSTLSNGQIVSNNGNVFATVSPTTTVNTIALRRFTTIGKWTSPVESDNGLTSWGNISITDTSAGNTVYEVGTNTASPIPVAKTYITSTGTLISSNAANIFVQAYITYLFSSFTQASTSSLLLNYVGTGVSGQYPVGFVFNNEMYVGGCSQGNTTNNEIFFFDRYHSWGNETIPVSAFTRYNQLLYAGSSFSGTVYKLNQGLAYNGSAYSMTAVMREDLLGSLELDKDIYKIYVLFRTQPTGTFTFSYRMDNYKTSGASWTDTIIDQTPGSAAIPGVAEIQVGQKGSSIQFKISQNDAGVQVGLVGIVIMYSYLNVR